MAFLQRIVIVISLLLSLLACSRELPEGTVVSVSVTSLPSRAYLGAGEQGVHKVFWAAGDKICVNGKVSKALAQTYDGNTWADFSFSQTLSSPYTAVSPSSAWVSASSVRIPASQTYCSGSFPAEAAVMAGYSQSASVNLGHVCAFMRLRIAPGNSSLRKISVRGNSGETLAGTFTVSYGSGGIPSITGTTSGATVVTLENCGQDGEYILAMAPVSFQHGFTVKAYDGEGRFMKLTTGAACGLEAGKMLNCPAADYVPNGTVVGGDTGEVDDEGEIPGVNPTLRVEWDRDNVTKWNGGYGRVHRLNDGRLMAVYERGGKGCCRFSSDNALNWTAEAIAVDRTEVSNASSETTFTNNANAEFAQLSAGNPYHPGRILYATNIRPSDHRSDIFPYSIACTASDDGGATWGERKVIYSSNIWQTAVSKGCWEPFVLELPDGRVQIYFADETPYYSLGFGYQNISVVESSDGGDTWGAARIVAYTEKHRDGMPVLIILDGNIYLAIEHNGVGEHLHPQIVYCSVQDNWSSPVLGASSQRFDPLLLPRDYANIYLGAPYIIFTDAYLVLSYQSSEGSTQVSDANSVMEVAVCPRTEVQDGRFPTMRAISRPFIIDQSTGKARWNSLCDLGGNSILAVSDHGGKIALMRGQILGHE